MLISEKSFLERLAAHVPGIAGYREREARRETDRRLRDYLARRLDEAAAALNPVRNRMTREGRLDALDAVGALDRTVKKTAATLRFADAGYGGLFDQVKVGEAELASLYAFDLALLDKVEGLAAGAAGAAEAADPVAAVASLADAARKLDGLVGRRAELFEVPQATPQSTRPAGQE